MKNKIVLLVFTSMSALLACGNSAESESQEVVDTPTEVEAAMQEETISEVKTTQENGKPRGSIYRCDDCFPSIPSAWIQVAYNDDMDKIVGIWMWDAYNETKIQMEILEQKVIRGEESGAAGSFKYPSSGDVYEFGMIGEYFNLIFDDTTLEYEYESFEDGE